jgi:hypothetical protein
MASTQQFAGDFSSQLHQLNGNQFYGPVSVSAPDPKDRGHLTAAQGDSRRKLAKQSHDEVNKEFESSLSEDLSWDG